MRQDTKDMLAAMGYDKPVVPDAASMSWVPARYRDATLEGMDRQDLAGKLTSWDWSRCPMLYGSHGTSKSWASAAIARKLIADGEVKSPLWMNVGRHFNDLRSSFSGDAPPPPPVGYDLLVFDDLGHERSTPWTREVLHAWMSGIYDDETKFIITTNMSLDALEAHVGSVVFDRLCEACQSVRVDGPSRRRGGQQ